MVRTHDQSSKADRLYERALDIREGLANGLWLPVMQHLALRRVSEAMVDLADWHSDTNRARAFALYRRAFCQGDSRAASNLAVDCFNRNDLSGYRRWLRLAARCGDTDARAELRAFETRLPHGNARKVGRIRPLRRAERR